jgi:hypothetical protein
VTTTDDFSFGDDIQVIDAGSAHVNWVKLLTYGAPGSGKTNLMSTLPDPLVVLLTEKHGEMTIKRVNPNAKIIYIEDIKKIVNGKVQVVKTAAEVLYSVLETLETEDHPYLSVALDSLTDMQQILLSQMKGGKPGAKVSLPEWGKLIDETKFLIQKFRNLNMHVGIICLSDEVQDDQNRLIYRPQLAGKKLPSSLVQYFNLCCFQRKQRDQSAVGGATYESVFDAGDEYYTKTHPALEPVEAPTVRGFIDKIARYAESHDEGDMPTQSSPISSVAQQRNAAREEGDRLAARLAVPRIKELFELLVYPDAKRTAEMKRFAEDDDLIESLEKRAEKLQELLDQPRIKELFDSLEAPHSKRVATLREHGGKADKVIAILEKAVNKKEAAEAAKAAKADKKAAK